MNQGKGKTVLTTATEFEKIFYLQIKSTYESSDLPVPTNIVLTDTCVNQKDQKGKGEGSILVSTSICLALIETLVTTELWQCVKQSAGDASSDLPELNL